jgi:hypothetical protein
MSHDDHDEQNVYRNVYKLNGTVVEQTCDILSSTVTCGDF